MKVFLFEDLYRHEVQFVPEVRLFQKKGRLRSLLVHFYLIVHDFFFTETPSFSRSEAGTSK